MKHLEQIIQSLSKEESRNYKLFINRTNESGERKDALLFDLFKKMGTAGDEDEIFQKLYGKGEKNVYYRLKNRVWEDLNLSLLIHNFNTNDLNYIFNQVLLSRIFQQKQQHRVALHYLNRAEKRANEIEGFELLDIIYNELIRLSHEILEINPEDYINKRKGNRVKLNHLQEIDDILAVLIYNVKKSQTFSGSNDQINKMLERTVNSFAQSKEVKNSPQLRFRIYHSLSRILLQKQDYQSLENYLLKTYTEFNREKLFNKNNHDTKLQMLTYISNALYKNGKSADSLEYAARLNEAMNEFNGLLKDKYIFFYYNTLVNNYARTDVERAIEILNEAKEKEVIRRHPVYIGFVYLNLAVSYFGLGDMRASLKNLIRLYMHDGFKSLDESFRLKIAVAELIVRYELEDFEFIEKKALQVKKEFGALLKEKNFQKDGALIDIIHGMTKSDKPRSDKPLLQKVQRFRKSIEQPGRTGEGTDASGEGEIIDYNSWLTKVLGSSGQR
jgi:hypothetical protein